MKKTMECQLICSAICRRCRRLHFAGNFVEIFDKIFVFSTFLTAKAATDRFELNVDSVVLFP